MIITQERSYEEQMADGNALSVYRRIGDGPDREHLGDYHDHDAVDEDFGQSGEGMTHLDEYGDLCAFVVGP